MLCVSLYVTRNEDSTIFLLPRKKYSLLVKKNIQHKTHGKHKPPAPADNTNCGARNIKATIAAAWTKKRDGEKAQNDIRPEY